MKRIPIEMWSVFLVALAIMASGCGGVKERVKMEPFEYNWAGKVETGGDADETGSIWREGEGLFADRRASNVNDIVTVRIVESSKAKRKATTSTGRETKIDAGVSSLFGLEGSMANHRLDPTNMVGMDASKSFKGSGSTERSGVLTGTITAVVKEVYPNGLMRIEGRRIVTVNDEEQYMRLSGLIRRKDIAIDNTILSTKIADAEIVYSGDGVIGREQKPGWLTRTLDAIWPF